MKKTLLISTALFLSVASFAQTKVTGDETLKGQTVIRDDNSRTQVNGSENSASETTVHTGRFTNAQKASTAKIKEERKEITARTKTKGQQVASKDRSSFTSVSAHSNAKLNASVKSNNLKGNSSISNSENASAGQKDIKSGELKKDAKQSVQATLKGVNRSQGTVAKTAANSATKINVASKTAMHTGSAAVHQIHVKPVRVKTGVQVRTVAGIGIK